MTTVELTANASRSSQLPVEYEHPRRGFPWGNVVKHAVLILFCLVVLLPLFWVVMLSIKSLPDGAQNYLWPKNFAAPLYKHYEWMWTKRPDVKTNFLNSVLVTTLTGK